MDPLVDRPGPAGEAAFHHPRFAALYGLLMRVAGGRLRAHRERALRGAQGRLLIVGAGRGDDLEALPPAVTSVVAVEPDPAMRTTLVPRAALATVPVHVVSGSATALPLPDASVDAVLCALVLCSVDDVPAALAEVRRVLRPGGRLHLLEHVTAEPGTARRWLQVLLDPGWARVAGGCRLTRDTRGALRAAGFDVSAVEDLAMRPSLPVCVPHVVGVARPVTGPAAAPRG